jgi:ribosome recycling factor
MKELKENISSAIKVLQHELSTLRVGRAHPSILDGVKVDYYGTQTPVSQVAAINAPEARMLTIKPWDKSQLKPIEKAIRESTLDLNPQIDSDIIRVAMPVPTEERRKDLTKTARSYGEKCKVSIRGARHNARDRADALNNENEAETIRKSIEEAVSEAMKQVDGIVSTREKEILTQ